MPNVQNTLSGLLWIFYRVCDYSNLVLRNAKDIPLSVYVSVLSWLFISFFSTLVIDMTLILISLFNLNLNRIQFK